MDFYDVLSLAGSMVESAIETAIDITPMYQYESQENKPTTLNINHETRREILEDIRNELRELNGKKPISKNTNNLIANWY